MMLMVFWHNSHFMSPRKILLIWGTLTVDLGMFLNLGWLFKPAASVFIETMPMVAEALHLRIPEPWWSLCDSCLSMSKDSDHHL